MSDVVPEIQDTVAADKKVEKSKFEEIKSKEVEIVENGAAKEEKTKNSDATTDKSVENCDATTDKSVENGSMKENGVSEAAEETTKDFGIVLEDDVCAAKRKSEVGLEPDEAAVEFSEKKQKVEDSEELEMAPNGVC